MVPDNFNFGGGAAETVLNPLVAVWLIIAVLLILTIQRKKVAVPLVFSFL